MALIERLQQNVDATAWRGEIPMSYVYTAGRAGDAFFKALRDRGVFLGARCPRCGTVHLPVQMYCERCFERLEGHEVEVPNRGTVHAFTVVHEAHDDTPIAAQPIAFVRFDGTQGGLFHRLVGVSAAQVRIGMPVEAVLAPAGERRGGIGDLLGFRPV